MNLTICAQIYETYFKLGSKHGDRDDIWYRKQLSTGALNKMEEILKRRKVVNIKKRLKLYNAIPRSVLMYNSCTWGLRENQSKGRHFSHLCQDPLISHQKNQLNTT